MTLQKTIIIGAGIGGIASAIRMKNKGHNVIVFEASDKAGGKLNEFKENGFRFDMGPSLFTMPHYIEELFKQSNKNISNYFEYQKHEKSCNYFFNDGIILSLYSDVEKSMQEVKEILNIDPKPFKERVENSKYIYEKTNNIFLHKSLHKLSTYLSKGILSSIRSIPKLSIFSTLHESNQSKLNHPKLVQIFDRYATYNGSNPYKAPGILNIIPHLENGYGTFFPKKGMYSIVTSLVKLAVDLGVEFKYNSPVDQIKFKKRKATGIMSKGVFFEANFIISNSDIKKTYDHLIKRKIFNVKSPSSSAIIFYWGIAKKFKQLDLHNIFFAEDYKSEFENIFNNEGVAYSDPTIYINISSKCNSKDAPNDSENWFVMINTSWNKGQDWNEYREESKKYILKKLSVILKEDISKLIVTEQYLDPIKIELNTFSHAGSLYGSSSNSKTSAFLRHSNFSKYKNLFHVGGSVHPGGGIPLCLLSAKIVSENIK